MVEVQGIQKNQVIKKNVKLGPKLPTNEEKLRIKTRLCSCKMCHLSVLTALSPLFDQEKKVYIRSTEYRVQNHSLELLDYYIFVFY